MKRGIISAVIIIIGVFFIYSTFLKTPELKFTTQDFAPFNYEENGKVAGPVAEIIREVCDEIDVECTFKLLPWDEAQKEVKEGNAHGMFVIGWNAERADWLTFSPPILRTEYGFFVREDNPLKFTTPMDVKGYSVFAYGPSNTSASLEEIKTEVFDMKMLLEENTEACLQKLSLGEGDAVYSNRDVGKAFISKLDIKNLRYAGAHKNLLYYIGFSTEHTNKRVIDMFNYKFVELMKDGTIREILEKYSMEPVVME